MNLLIQVGRHSAEQYCFSIPKLAIISTQREPIQVLQSISDIRSCHIHLVVLYVHVCLLEFKYFNLVLFSTALEKEPLEKE